MALAQLISQRTTRPETGLTGHGPFGLAWLPAVLISQVAFILCRAGAQGFVSIDDAAYWIVGLMPFVLQFVCQRFFSSRSMSIVELWILSIAIYLTVQIFDLAHFAEYPINLWLELGWKRYLVTASAFVAPGLLLLFASSLLSNEKKARVGSYLAAAIIVIPLFAMALFQPY